MQATLKTDEFGNVWMLVHGLSADAAKSLPVKNGGNITTMQDVMESVNTALALGWVGGKVTATDIASAAGLEQNKSVLNMVAKHMLSLGYVTTRTGKGKFFSV